MARNNDSDKSDAAQTFDSLNVGDVIRLPNYYSNALAVEETTEIGVRVEFVDDSLAARGTSKDLIRSTFTGEYGLVAGTSDKGTVWDVEVVARVADDEDSEDDDEEETPVETDGGADSEDDDRENIFSEGDRLRDPEEDLTVTVTGFSESARGTLRVHTEDDDGEGYRELYATLYTRLRNGDIVRVEDTDDEDDADPEVRTDGGVDEGAYCGAETTVEGETISCEKAPGHGGDHAGHVPDEGPGLLWDLYEWSDPEVRTDGGVDEGGETIHVGDAVALDEWGVGTVTELPQDRDDGLLRIRFDRSSRNLTVYLTRRVEEVDRIPDAADSDDDPDDEGLVEFTVTFEAPVSSADLRDTFQDLADAAAEEADSSPSTNADDDVRTDGGDPVADAAAFEDALQSFVEGAILDGVHPSDASTVLFTEANQIAGAMWSPDRDDAEILP